MSVIESEQLLQTYAREGSEEAFRELVDRYVDFVYSTALRKLNGDSHLAEDVVQTVFSDLARKSRAAASIKMLGGWLHQHTCFTAANLLRGELRRRNREKEAVEMNIFENIPESDWQQLAPVLDDALSNLEATDRHAIILRFFERRNFQAVGVALGVSQDAAQKRVARAVEKLRTQLVRRGAVLSAAALGAALSHQAMQAAPAGLAARVSSQALVAVSSVSGLTLLMLRVIASTKIKMALAAIAVLGLFILPFRLQKKEMIPTSVANTVSSQISNLVSAKPFAQTTALNAQAAPAAESGSSDFLHLTTLLMDQSKPAGNVEIWGWPKDGTRRLAKLATTDASGRCDIPIVSGTPTLELYTRKDGLADAHLLWNVAQGAEIPISYTVRLIGATPIGGCVLGPDGEPVEGAKVGFNHDDDPDAPAQPENHEFGWIEVVTDSQGRWSINRIAADMIHRIYGSAKHSSYVDSSLFSASKDRVMEKQLREETYVFHLARPVAVRGLVVDSAGKPVAGAKVLFGLLGYSGSRETRTLSDGTFILNGCRPGNNPITAQAKGFTATTLEVNCEADADPVKLILKSGKTLRMQIVDTSGLPIAKANVWLETMNKKTPESMTRAQADFDANVGEDGRVVWENAPEGESQFDVASRGYMRTTVVIPADGKEHAVILQPALVVFGEVCDVFTKQPIPNFRLICGCPGIVIDPQSGNRTISDDASQAFWNSIGRYTVNFHNGQFHHSLEEGVIYQNTNYIFKIDAEGYAPFVSRVIHSGEGEVRLDAELRPVSNRVVRVTFPDGKPATAADVGLITGARLRLISAGFSRETGRSPGCLLRTDDKGSFRFKEDDTVSTIIVAHPQGYAESTPAALASRPVIVLQPWGRIEGNWLCATNPVPKRELILQFADLDHQSIDLGSYRVETDAQCRFVWAQVPPGRIGFVELVPARINPGGMGWIHKTLPNKVLVRPGETNIVTLGELSDLPDKDFP